MLLISLLQTPLPTKALGTPLPVTLPKHSQSEQRSTLTQVPQQSPPSKLQKALFVSGLQKPSPTKG